MITNHKKPYNVDLKSDNFKSVHFIGIAGLIVSFIWMLLSQSSVGWFLVLASISGAVTGRGIAIIKNTRPV